MDPVTIFALLGSVFMGISIGASSVAPAFGPVNSSGAVNVLRAALLAGIFALVGSIVQGGNVANTVGSGILMGSISVLQAATVLIVASALVIVSFLTDYPMPTAFTVVGAVIGSAFSFGNAVSWSVFSGTALYWLLVPFFAAGLAYVLAKALREIVPNKDSSKLKYLLVVSGCYMAYTAGAGSVGLAVGPLSSLELPQLFLLTLGGLAILAGSWIYSPRIIKAVSYDYSNIGPRRSIASLLSAAFLAQIGIFYGVPISFNEAIIAAVIGSGLVEGGSSVDGRKLGRTVLAWIGAFLLAGVLTFAVGLLI
ncbi:MAG: inorganic phosphate transporter [Nanohaloarchaea archaeon]|nr:inorganic phosphate transporter [Candidatus Nanohaloarchaea archaeon]